MRDATVKQGDNSQAIVQEFHGNLTLNELPREGLITEAAAAQLLRKQRARKRRHQGGTLATMAALCAALTIGVAYWVFWKKKSLTLAEIFNAFAPAMLPSLLGILIPALAAVVTGVLGWDSITKPGAAERDLTRHAEYAKHVAEVKNWDQNWRAEVRARAKDLAPSLNEYLENTRE